MLGRDDIQLLLYQTMEKISQDLLDNTNYLYIIEGQVTEIDKLGNCYFFNYQNEEYVGFSITGEEYAVGDLIYVLFSKKRNIKKMILSKTKSFSNNNIRTIANNANEAANEAEKTAKEALEKITDISGDNKITPGEKILLKQEWDLIKKEYPLLLKETELYGGEDNELLLPLITEYKNNYSLLKTYIEPILENMSVATEVDSDEFLEKFNNYYISKQDILNKISEIVKSISDATKELSEANKSLLDDISNDNKLTPSEKQSILKEWEEIQNEYPLIRQQSLNYGIPNIDYTNYYNNLKTYIEPLLLNIEETSDIIGEDFRNKFLDYYLKRQELQNHISEKAKEIADNATLDASDALENSKNLFLKTSSQVFTKTINSSNFTPSNIEISAELRGVTFSDYLYQTSETSDWITIVSGQHGFIINDDNLLTIENDSDLFTNNNNSIIIKATSSNENIYDIVTIIKVSDGVEGKDGISVILTNEAHIFPAGVSQALSSSTTTDIYAYLGTTLKNIDITSISTLPVGMSYDITNNNTTKPTITFITSTLLSQSSGSIDITMEINNTVFVKTFSYSLGFKGSEGESSYSIILGNEAQTIPCTNTGITSNIVNIEIPVLSYYGITQVASVITVSNLPAGVTSQIINGTTTGPGKVTLTIPKDNNLGDTDYGTIKISTTVSEKIFDKTFSWSKSLSGANGISGETGRTYFLETNSLIIKKGADNILQPSNITFSSYYRDGSAAIKTVYSCRFIIEESSNGTTFTTKYTSTVNESIKVYTPSNSNIKIIRCTMYAAGGTINSLDIQSVTVLTDIDNIEIGGRNLLGGTESKYFLETYSNFIDNTPFKNFTVLTYDNIDGTTYKDFNYSSTSIYNYLGNVEPNTEYTISFWCKGEGKATDGSIFYSYMYNPNEIISTISSQGYSSSAPDGTCKIDFTNEWQKIWITRKTSSTAYQGKHILFARIFAGTKVSICGLKLEKSNKMSDWTPAPEDTTADIEDSKNETISRFNSSINETEEQINLQIQQVLENVGMNTDALISLTNEIQLTNETTSFIRTTINQLQDTVDGKVDTSTILEWARFDGSSLELGASNSQFKALLTNEELGFYDSGTKVAWVSNNELHILRAVIETNLQIGTFTFNYDTTYGLTIR